MVNFYIKLDEKFDEIIKNAKENQNNIPLLDVISLKSFIYDIYNEDNNFENKYIKKNLMKIDFKI